MGLMSGIFGFLFGDGRNVLRETAEVFVENAEGAGARDLELRRAVLEQYAGEFAGPRRGLFDRLIDALNRLPRPALALGTLGLFISAMVDPIWFAARMQGIALVPEPLWWLLGAIISFYFGARHQAKGQAFQRSIAQTMARASEVSGNIRALEALAAGAGEGAVPPDAAALTAPAQNPALAEWKGKA